MKILGFDTDKIDIFHVLSRFTMIVWGLLVVWVLTVGVHNYTTTPFEITSTHLLTPVVHPGEPVKIVHTVKEDQACFVRFNRYIRGLEAENHQIIVQSGWFNTEGDNTLRTVDIAMPVPLTAVAGDYTAFTRYQYRCNFLDQVFPRVVDRGAVSFKVVAVRGHEDGNNGK
jgi:hypothetical protein